MVGQVTVGRLRGQWLDVTGGTTIAERPCRCAERLPGRRSPASQGRCGPFLPPIRAVGAQHRPFVAQTGTLVRQDARGA